jgi:hypothetical protein
MSLFIFLVGLTVGFWIWRYSDAMLEDIGKFGNWEPKWLTRSIGAALLLLLFSLPIVIGAGLVALCGYQFNLSDFLGERE